MTSEGHARNVPDARETPGTGRALGSLFSDAHRRDLANSVACDCRKSRNSLAPPGERPTMEQLLRLQRLAAVRQPVDESGYALS